MGRIRRSFDSAKLHVRVKKVLFCSFGVFEFLAVEICLNACYVKLVFLRFGAEKCNGSSLFIHLAVLFVRVGVGGRDER